MKLIRLLLASLPAAFLLLPGLAYAGAPTLQISPLQYEDTLSGKVKNGHIDVANPADAPVTVQASVRRFTQTGTNGDLAFADDSDLTAAIKLDLTTFQLQPHDAVRVLFSVDPQKLPTGGTYAAIFFRTVPIDNAGSGSSYVSQSANIGTLLILNNGTAVPPSGGVSAVSMSFWQLGSGLNGSALVANTSSPHGGTAFRPALTARVLPWGHAASQPGGLILPGNNRRFAISRPGSFFGLLPVTITDTATHTSRTAWVFACTGLSGWILLVLLVTALVLLASKSFKRRLHLSPRRSKPVPALKPIAPAIAVEPVPAAPEPIRSNPAKPGPSAWAKPSLTANPRVTKLVVQAETATSGPPTASMPGPPIEPTPPAEEPRSVHKVSVKADVKPNPDPATPKARSKPKTTHKITVESHDHRDHPSRIRNNPGQSS